MFTTVPVDTFDIVVEDETLRTASKGYYLGKKSPGKYDVRIEAEGYDSDMAEVEIIEGMIVTQDFVLNRIPDFHVTGDINGDYKTDLADVILALKVLSQTQKAIRMRMGRSVWPM